MTSNKKHESGIVSIMVTMVMLIVISLIVLGFAEISRTEQSNTSDAQLSTEAYYGAESGVNDAIAAINANGLPIQNKTSCGATPGYTLDGLMNSNSNVYYTCLLINSAPTSLSYTVSTSSTVIPLTSASAFTNLTLDWGVAQGSVGVKSCNNPKGTFPDATKWNNCNFPILRVDLLDANGSLARANWSSNTATMFFAPNKSGISQTATLSSRGSVFAASCNSTDCIGNISLGGGGKSYYMRVTTLYLTDSKLTISSGGQPFYGTQVVIDSTGKAQDILRRIQVAVDLTSANSYIVPSAALITEDSVCKQFAVYPGYLNINNPSMNNSGSGGDPLC